MLSRRIVLDLVPLPRGASSATRRGAALASARATGGGLAVDAAGDETRGGAGAMGAVGAAAAVPRAAAVPLVVALEPQAPPPPRVAKGGRIGAAEGAAAPTQRVPAKGVRSGNGALVRDSACDAWYDGGSAASLAPTTVPAALAWGGGRLQQIAGARFTGVSLASSAVPAKVSCLPYAARHAAAR